MFAGIIRYLRICNADALASDKRDREKLVMTALKEGRTFITSGQVYERYRKYFASPRDCVKLSNSGTALDQFKELVNGCRLVIRLEDLFARCSLCNTTPFIIISAKEFKEHHSRYIAELEEEEEKLAEKSTVAGGGEKQSPTKTAKPFLVPAIENGELKLKRPAFRIDFESFGKMKFISKMPVVDKFYICSNLQCGHIYWDGCHSNNFIPNIKALIEDA